MTTYDKTKFENATYYDCLDSETLEHEEPELAIEALFDETHEKGISIDDHIKKIGAVEVSAYERKVVADPTELAQSHIDRMLESFDEDWAEDYGSIEEDFPPWEGDELKVVTASLVGLFTAHIKRARVWQCDVVTVREYSEEEVTAILKENCPHWWEEEKQS